MEKKVLGRGLDALFEDKNSLEVGNPFMLDIKLIQVNPEQPRKKFDKEKLEELAESIKEKGILQPIIVKPHNDDYIIVAGERRFHAAQLLGLHSIPVLIKNIDHAESIEIAIIENIQREDLNPVEEARCYDKLIKDYNYTPISLAKRIGKSREYIVNLIRMLVLPQEILEYVILGDLTAGHARALINSEHQKEILKIALDNKLSVRDTENIVKQYKDKEGQIALSTDFKQASNNNVPHDSRFNNSDIEEICQSIEKIIGMKMQINFYNNGGGVVTINFKKSEQVDYIIQILSGEVGIL